jgi:hypothetical protein
MNESFQDVNGDVGNDEELHTRSDVEIETDAVSAYGGARSHAEASLRGKGGGVKAGRGLKVPL